MLQQIVRVLFELYACTCSRDYVQKKDVKLKFIEIKYQLTILTKPLVEEKFNFIKNKLFIM